MKSNFDKGNFEPRPDSGRLMAAQSKRTEKSPDYWGEITINPKDLNNVTVENGLYVYKLSGWKKTSKSGSTYLSLSVSRQTQQPAPQQRRNEEDEI